LKNNENNLKTLIYPVSKIIKEERQTVCLVHKSFDFEGKNM